jgi:hypothetical protein
MLLKIQKSDIKIPDFRQNFQNKKKNFKNVFVHTAKCLKAKKSWCFFIKKKNVLTCILALITSLLKSREHWPKFQKQQKFYFFLLFLFFYVCLLVSGV